MSNLENEWLTPDEIAKKLKFNRKRVYRMVKSEGLPALRLGRDIRINSMELDKWLDSRAVGPQNEEGGESDDDSPRRGAG